MSGVLKSPPNEFRLFAFNVATITLMAGIVEGALNHLVATELMGAEDPPTLTKQQRLFQEFMRDKIEMDGGWQKKSNFYNMAFEQSVQAVVGSDLWKSLTHLTTLRNSTAHGTSIVYPDSPLPQEAKGHYPYKWQEHLKQCSDYLDRELGVACGLSAHLRGPQLSEHFWDIAQKVSEKFLDAHPNHAGLRFFGQISSLKFGYRWNAPSKPLPKIV